METLNDYLPTTPDLNAERLEALRKLWPDLFTNEGKPNPTAVQAALGLGTPAAERYAFTWSGKTAARQQAFAPTTYTLVPDAARSFQPEKGRHAIIEGENLHALKLLLAGYRERVKCIYIDPPYNTGKDFVYSDNYTEDKQFYLEQTGGIQDGVRADTNPDTNGRYHSDWLSMMYSRLLLARQLLREDGVVFLSIDDNEAHNLRKLLDEVFGEENFIGQVSWLKKRKGSFLSKTLVSVTEHVIIYSKGEGINLFGGEADKEQSQPIVKRTNSIKTLSFPENTVKTKLSDGIYHAKVYGDGTSSVELLEEIKVSDGLIKNSFRLSGPFTWSQANLDDQLNRGCVLIINTINFQLRAYKAYGEGEGTKGLSSFINGVEIKATNEEGSEELERIFGKESILEYPKPWQLVTHLVKAATYFEPEAIVLDFFAGSGTTFQGVLEANKLDEGDRQCILVQLPVQTEKDSNAYQAGYHKISDITIERCKRVVTGYGDTPQPLETGFRVWRLESSRFPAATFQPKPDQSADEQLAELKKYLAAKQAVLQLPFADDDQPARIAEILLKNGFSLNYTLSEPLPEYAANRIVRVTDQETTATALLSLDDTLTDATVQQLSHQPPAERFIAPERAFNTTAKWNLKMHLKDNLLAT